VVVANNVVGPVEGQAVLEGVVCSWILSSICNQQFGGSGEYNVHTHHIENKGSYFQGYWSSLVVVDCYCCQIGGFGFLDSGFPQWDSFVGGYFLLVPGCYCFDFPLSYWNYLSNGMDFPYSTIQKHEPVEWERA
jgi:hypothetical protein